MKKVLICKKRLKNFCVLFTFLALLFFQTNLSIVKAISMDNDQSEFVTEELRLKVPSDFKDAWLEAEKNVWEPWLSRQEGFLGRQIFWNNDKEEALILVNWQNKKLWKKISMQEVNDIQQKFEEDVKASLNLDLNPFKLIYEGELFKQV